MRVMLVMSVAVFLGAASLSRAGDVPETGAATGFRKTMVGSAFPSRMEEASSSLGIWMTWRRRDMRRRGRLCLT